MFNVPVSLKHKAVEEASDAVCDALKVPRQEGFKAGRAPVCDKVITLYSPGQTGVAHLIY